jgi:hypothetical protein
LKENQYMSHDILVEQEETDVCWVREEINSIVKNIVLIFISSIVRV